MANQPDDRPPWKRKNPKKKRAAKLTAAQRGEARARARVAGRSYPNLVDNMAVARKANAAKKASKTKKASKARKASKAGKSKTTKIAKSKRTGAPTRKTRRS